jgi:hypothetical protein
VAIGAVALNAAISRSILGDPDACFVMMMALPFVRRADVVAAWHRRPVLSIQQSFGTIARPL